MKCTKCNVDQPIEQFSWKNKKNNIRKSICKTCHKIYCDKHYNLNKEKRIAQSSVRRKAVKHINHHKMIEYLSDKQCIDCGENDIVVLEFDHRENEEKINNVACMLACPWKSVIAEIEKCDIRCANCHRRSTAKRFGNYRTQHGG